MLWAQGAGTSAEVEEVTAARRTITQLRAELRDRVLPPLCGVKNLLSTCLRPDVREAAALEMGKGNFH